MHRAALRASYLRYFLMGSQATSRITMEGSSSRRALMAEIYRVMMSDVLTPMRGAGEQSRVPEHRFGYKKGSVRSMELEAKGLQPYWLIQRGENRSLWLRKQLQPQIQAQRLL